MAGMTNIGIGIGGGDTVWTPEEFDESIDSSYEDSSSEDSSAPSERLKPEKNDIDAMEDFTNSEVYPMQDESEFREVNDLQKVINEEYLSQFWERCKDIPEANLYELKTNQKTIIGAINELYDMIKSKS